MRRIVVIGGPGNGKSTMARRLASEFGLAHIEMDGLFHVTDWGSATSDEFRDGLVAAIERAPEGWVTCGNYLAKSQEIHIEQADTLVWLDLPRVTVTWRTFKRTMRRWASREPLYGNDIREPLDNFYRWDPDKNVIRWAWVHHPIYRAAHHARITSGDWDHLDIHHLTSRSAITDYLDGELATDR